MRNSDPLAALPDLIQVTIDALPGPVAAVNSEGTILLVNKQWERNTSIQAGDIETATRQIISANNGN